MAVERRFIDVDGARLSYLHAGNEKGPPVLLLHGTFWSRVWLPVLPALEAGRTVVALDFPGFGRSGGELDVASASVPALAALTGRVVDAFGWSGFAVIGHDIGGGVAQHLAVHDRRVERLGLVNAVVLDSWPVPAVERFADPEVRAATTAADLVAARRASMTKAVARRLSDEEVEDYVSPWHSEPRARSWMAMAAAADPRFTLDLVEPLRRRDMPMALIWGEDDEFQKLEFAERFVAEVPAAVLGRVAGRHIPQEDDPDGVGRLLTTFLGRA